jgi:hypothetical protein
MAFDTGVGETNPKWARVLSAEGREIVRRGYSDPVEVNRHTATRDGVAGRMSKRMLTHPTQEGNKRQKGPGGGGGGGDLAREKNSEDGLSVRRKDKMTDNAA